MTEDERRDYARGFSALEGGGEVSEREVAAAAEQAGGMERQVVFGAAWLELDGWQWDAGRRVWMVPPRAGEPEEEAPVRTGAADPDSPRGGDGGSSGGGGLATVPDDDLDQLIEKARAYERWRQDPDQRRRRWDRRVLLLGRVLRR